MSGTPQGDRPKRRRNITIDCDVDAETAARVGERRFSGEVERLLRAANAEASCAADAVWLAMDMLGLHEVGTTAAQPMPSDDGGDSGGPG